MAILGYVLTALNYGCFITSRFLREKKWIVTLDVMAKILLICALLCFNSLTGSYNMLISLIMLIILNIKERKAPDKKWITPWALLEIALLLVFIFTYDGLPSILVWFTSTVTIWHTWFMPPQIMRIIGGWNGILFFIYQMLIKNWVGVLELLVITSNFVAYYKYKKIFKEEKEKLNENN